MKLILASGSLGRRKLFEALKIPFTVIESDIDEEKIVDPDPVKMAIARATAKAEAVLKQLSVLGFQLSDKSSSVFSSRFQKTENRQTDKLNSENRKQRTDNRVVIISADTVGYQGKWIFNKPKTRKEAFEILKRLSGKTHKYVSAHCIIQLSVLGCRLSDNSLSVVSRSILKTDKPKTDKLKSENRKLRTDNRGFFQTNKVTDYDIASVTFHKLTDRDIDFYLDRVPYTKLCGGLAIFDSPQNFVIKTEGSLSTIIGICLEKVISYLTKATKM